VAQIMVPKKMNDHERDLWAQIAAASDFKAREQVSKESK